MLPTREEALKLIRDGEYSRAVTPQIRQAGNRGSIPKFV